MTLFEWGGDEMCYLYVCEAVLENSYVGVVQINGEVSGCVCV